MAASKEHYSSVEYSSALISICILINAINHIFLTSLIKLNIAVTALVLSAKISNSYGVAIQSGVQRAIVLLLGKFLMRVIDLNLFVQKKIGLNDHAEGMSLIMQQMFTLLKMHLRSCINLFTSGKRSRCHKSRRRTAAFLVQIWG